MKNLAGMRRAARTWLLDEGVDAAIETAISICRDGNELSDTRTACADIILRAAGMYHREIDGAGQDVPDAAAWAAVEGMTLEELEEVMRRTEALIATSRSGGVS